MEFSAEKSHIKDYENYFTEVLQEAIFELEKREWCNLKLNDIHNSIDEKLFNWHIKGTVSYENGFLISIEKLMVTDIMNAFFHKTVNNVTSTTGSITGKLDLSDVKVGFNVNFEIIDGKPQRYTGTYNYHKVLYEFTIEKNFTTKEIRVFARLISLSAGSGNHMIYMPANNYTEVLSSKWMPSSNFNSVQNWATQDMVPIILDIIKNKKPFPDACIGCIS